MWVLLCLKWACSPQVAPNSIGGSSWVSPCGLLDPDFFNLSLALLAADHLKVE